jgi:hypothetical protein
LVLVALAVTAHWGCSDGSDGAQPVRLQGSAQKGPYLVGTPLTIWELDANGEATSGRSYPTNTKDDLGTYDISVSSETGYILIRADGQFLMESINVRNGVTLALESVYEIPSDAAAGMVTAHTNIVTHITGPRALAALHDDPDMGLGAAIASAEAELWAVAPILDPGGGAAEEGSSTSLTGGNSPANQRLAALSCSVDYSARMDDGWTHQGILNEIRSEFETTGTLGAASVELIMRGQRFQDPRPCYATMLGLSPDAADPSEAWDTDGDGVRDAVDPDDDDDGYPDGEDPQPFYPNDLNGVWCDEATQMCWQKAPSYEGMSPIWPDQAAAHCENVLIGGLTSWRVPTINELGALVSGCADPLAGCAAGAGPGPGGSYATSGTLDGPFDAPYISATESPPDRRWVLDFQTGGMSTLALSTQVPQHLVCARNY